MSRRAASPARRGLTRRDKLAATEGLKKPQAEQDALIGDQATAILSLQALAASNASTIANLLSRVSALESQMANHGHSIEQISGSLDGSRLVTNSVTAAKIARATLTWEESAQSTYGPGRLNMADLRSDLDNRYVRKT